MVLVAFLLLYGCHRSTPLPGKAQANSSVFYNPPAAPPETMTVEQARKAVLKHPHYGLPHFDLGLAYYKKRDYVKAVTEFNEALRISPERKDPRFWLGFSYRAMGNTIRAREVFEKLVHMEMPPKNRAEAYVSLGNCYWETNRAADAQHSYEQALVYDPTQDLAYYALGSIAEQLDDAVKAQAYFSAALRYANNKRTRARAFAGLGELAEARNDLTTAESNYREALRNDSSIQTAKDGLQRLQDD
jgi:tetratricopeptide (TPR) repeat protein